MSDLEDFLRKRLDEDEAAALNAGSGEWYDELDESNLGIYSIAHASRHAPVRVLREVQAGRAILAEHERYTTAQMRHVLFLLAAVYRDHPDYDEAWKP